MDEDEEILPKEKNGIRKGGKEKEGGKNQDPGRCRRRKG